MKTFQIAAIAATAAFALSLPAAPVQAQSAAQYNRASQALQICASAMGAGIPECAKLRGQFGGGASVPGIGGLGGGFGGGAAAGIAGLLGSAMSAASQQQAQPSMAPQVNGNQQAYASCIQGAGGNPTVIQACASILGAAGPPAMAQQTALPPGQYMLPSAQRSQDTAMGIHAAGQSYQACVAANPNNWQSCLSLMNGGAPVAVPGAGMVPGVGGVGGIGANAGTALKAAKMLGGLLGK